MRLDWLRPLYREFGGYVSVYLDTSRAVENGPAEVALRWRAARSSLTAQGADQPTLDAVEEVLTEPDRNDPERGAPGRVVFARAGAIVLQDTLPSVPAAEVARFAPLPDVFPLLAARPAVPQFVLVSANREGGEVLGGRSVAGGWPVHKTSVGGWSQARYQRSVEETWDDNARQVADEVTKTARRTHAVGVVIAGDSRPDRWCWSTCPLSSGIRRS